VNYGNGQAEYEYDIDYLESQMRGADFERMLVRYDQEMALGTFTPLLLQQTADVGSYNLGGLHYQMYLLTQNAMNDDFAMYVEKYILKPLVKYNFSQSTAPARFVFEQQDNSRADLVKMIIQGMIGKSWKPDVDEIGKEAGLTFRAVGPVDPNTDPNATSGGQGGNGDPQPKGDSGPVPAGQTGNPSGN
jgi:hypothetical protein